MKELNIDAKLKSALKDIVRRREKLNADKAQIAEDLKSLAEGAGVKAADLAKIVTLYEKEMDKGGVIQHEQDVLEAAEQLTR